MSITEAAHRELLPANLKDMQCTKTHELPVMPGFPGSHGSPECPVSLVYPVSNGQGLDKQIEKKLKELAARNRCTERGTAKKRLWKLMRDLKAIEKGIGCELRIGERMTAFDEWYRLSLPVLDSGKTRDDYLAEFIAGLGKVRVPTGEGDTLNKALEAVSKLTSSDLPDIPGFPKAPQSWRRLLALHLELSSRSTRKNKTYFLSYRDAAKARNGLSHQVAYDITLVLDRLEAIKIIDKGKAHPNGRKAAEFRYLLPESIGADIGA
jgi:hypothetical protein